MSQKFVALARELSCRALAGKNRAMVVVEEEAMVEAEAVVVEDTLEVEEATVVRVAMVVAEATSRVVAEATAVRVATVVAVVVATSRVVMAADTKPHQTLSIMQRWLHQHAEQAVANSRLSCVGLHQQNLSRPAVSCLS